MSGRKTARSLGRGIDDALDHGGNPMQEIMKLKAERKAGLAAHPFYKWVEGSDVPIEDRLTFAPIMANFVMNFRDMNKWFIRFPDAKNQFERIINGNTMEDETHSRLFL